MKKSSRSKITWRQRPGLTWQGVDGQHREVGQCYPIVQVVRSSGRRGTALRWCVQVTDWSQRPPKVGRKAAERYLEEAQRVIEEAARE